MVQDQPICVHCKKPIPPDGVSYDVWFLKTLYQEGEVNRTGEQVEPELTENDYISVGACCAKPLARLWNEFVSTVVRS